MEQITLGAKAWSKTLTCYTCLPPRSTTPHKMEERLCLHWPIRRQYCCRSNGPIRLSTFGFIKKKKTWTNKIKCISYLSINLSRMMISSDVVQWVKTCHVDLEKIGGGGKYINMEAMRLKAFWGEWPLWWSSIKSLSVTLTINHTTVQTRIGVCLSLCPLIYSKLHCHYHRHFLSGTSPTCTCVSFIYWVVLRLTSNYGSFWTYWAFFLLEMALCTLSFPAHLGRAAASDPQESNSFSSKFCLGADVLGKAQHKFNQVWQHVHTLLVSLVSKVGFFFFVHFWWFQFHLIWICVLWVRVAVA